VAGAIERLRKAIFHTRPGMLRQSFIIWHDNARSHTAKRTCDSLRHYGWMGYGPTSLQSRLRASVFSLFEQLKNTCNLAGKRSARDADMKQAVTSWPQALDTNGIQASLPRPDKCLNVNGY
jgi:hypothetical protein